MNVTQLLGVIDKPIHTFSVSLTKTLVQTLRPYLLSHHQIAVSSNAAAPQMVPLPRSFLRVRSVAVIESLLTEFERPVSLRRLCSIQQTGTLMERLDNVIADIARRLWQARKEALPLTHTHSTRAMLWNVSGMQTLTSASSLAKSRHVKYRLRKGLVMLTETKWDYVTAAKSLHTYSSNYK